MSYEKPFYGLKVLDMSQGYAGPYCGGLLAQYGADVVKVEPPEGDWARSLGKSYGDQSTISLAANRGKKSIVLNLKNSGGLKVAHELAARCDVFIEGFRPGVCERFGLSYNDLSKINTKVIYLAISGFGHYGPYSRLPSTDTVAQAFSGLMSINRGNDDIPHRLGHFIIDCVTSLYAYQALSSALYARRDESIGRFIDCSLMQAAAAVQASKIADFYLEDGKTETNNAPAGSYDTKNGFIAITLVKETQFRPLCIALGQPDIAENPLYQTFALRAKNMGSLGPLVQHLLMQRTATEWSELFQEAGVLAHPVSDYGDWMSDAHVIKTKAFQMVDQQGVGLIPIPQIPGMGPFNSDDLDQQVPFLGQHSSLILRDLGYTKNEIAKLAADGAVNISGV